MCTHWDLAELKRKVQDDRAPNSERKKNFSSSEAEAALQELNSKRRIHLIGEWGPLWLQPVCYVDILVSAHFCNYKKQQ